METRAEVDGRMGRSRGRGSLDPGGSRASVRQAVGRAGTVASGSEGERGFALLVALLAIVGLTALATGGFLLANSEHRTSENYVSVVEAFYLANMGLSDFVGESRGFPDPTWIRTYPGGRAEVVAAHIATDAGGLRVYRVTSTGVFDAPRGGDVRRTVGTLVTATPVDLNLPNSAFFSGGGVRKNGAAGLISGEDASSPGECPAAGGPTRPALVVPQGEFEGQTDALEGDPPLLEVPGAELQDSVRIDWPAMISGDVVSPDVRIGSNVDDGSATTWPDSFPSDEFPVVLVEEVGDFALPSSGQGILIVKNNLTLNGNLTWEGPVIVGGSVTSNGQNNIDGAVVTGLNEIFFGQEVAGDDIADTLNGTKRFRYHACNLWRAALAAAVLSEQAGAWFEDL